MDFFFFSGVDNPYFEVKISFGVGFQPRFGLSTSLFSDLNLQFTKSYVETKSGKMETKKSDGPGPAILGGG